MKEEEKQGAVLFYAEIVLHFLLPYIQFVSSQLLEINQIKQQRGIPFNEKKVHSRQDPKSTKVRKRKLR